MQPLVDKKQLLHDTIGYILEEELIEEMSKIAKIRETVQDEIIIHVGDELKMIPIVVYGSIKVSRENTEGDELLLYYIEGGDTCAMTLQ
jgi:CRP/FNR family transcriptional regulator